MTENTTRRDFVKSAAAVVAGAGIASTTSIFDIPTAHASGSTGSGDIQAQLENAIKRHNVAGASVALYNKGEMKFAAAGIANMVTGVEMTTDTIMQIGSVTKVFTATIIMQLVDEGLLELDRPVVEYLPDFRVGDPEASKKITVKMLINHTSGIDGEVLPDHGHDEETIEKLAQRAASMGQIHAPGRDVSYCNTGAALAGYLAQRVLGRSWYDLVKERIYAPLAMEHSVSIPEDALLYRASVGHHLNQGSGKLDRTSFVFLPMSFAPAGSTLMMSARDLCTFGAAHMAGGMGLSGTRLLSEASTMAMRKETSQYKGAGGSRFGLGWSLLKNGAVGHGGGGPGIRAQIYADPEADLVVVVNTNTAHGYSLITELANDWVKAISGSEAFTTNDPSIVDETVDTKRYVGTYENIIMRHVVIEHTDGLAVSSSNKFAFYDTSTTEVAPFILAKPVGNDSFVLVPPDDQAANNPVQGQGKTVIKFVNAMNDGRMEHLAASGRLYLRRK